MAAEATSHVLILDEETRNTWLLFLSRANLYETVGSGRKGGKEKKKIVRPPPPSSHGIKVVRLPTFSLDTHQVYKVAVDGRFQSFYGRKTMCGRGSCVTGYVCPIHL